MFKNLCLSAFYLWTIFSVFSVNSAAKNDSNNRKKWKFDFQRARGAASVKRRDCRRIGRRVENQALRSAD